jgi:ketosteroid isomerase-like protein
MDREAAAAYASAWAEAWNRRDLDAILAHFADDVVFSSPRALDAVGAPTVRGKRALRRYWEIALERVRVLQFSVERVIWDEAARELAIVYDREVDARRDRAAEVLHFGADGKVIRGEVFYGVIPG